MTVTTSTSRSGPYAGAGTTGPFAVTFRFLDKTHLRVVKTVGGVDTTLAVDTQYTVAGVGAATGSVTLTTALAIGEKLTIIRNVPATQDAEYVQNDAFPAESHETALDKLTMLVQQNAEQVARALLFPVSDTASAELPTATARANMLLSFDANGAPVATIPSAQSAAGLQTALADPTQGDAMLGVKKSGASTVTRTQHDVNDERLSLLDFYSGDAAAAAVLAAARNTAIVAPPGTWSLFPTAAQVPAVLDLLSRLEVEGDQFTVNLPTGVVNLTASIAPGPDALAKVRIKGVANIAKTISSLSAVSGAAKAYSVEIILTNASGIAAGDFLYIPTTGITGTGDYQAHYGGWPVTGVAGNIVTILNTYHGAAFPTTTLTGGTVYVIKSVLKFAAVDGFRIAGGHLSMLQDVALQGDWNLTAATGTTGAHGISITTPRVLPGDDPNAPQMGSGGITTGKYVAIFGFGEQGIVGEIGTSFSCNYLASCGNRKRGIYVSQSDWRGKLVMACGNGEDGMISDLNGSADAGNSAFSGNGLNGVWATNGGYVNCASSSMIGNLQYSVEARGGASRITADASIMRRSVSGIVASNGGAVQANSAATISDTTDDGISCVLNGTVSALSAVITNAGDRSVYADFGGVVTVQGGTITGSVNGDYLAQNDGVIRKTDGVTHIGTTLPTSVEKILNANFAGLQITASSIGDATFALDNSGGGTFTARYVFKSDGTLHPSGDATQPLGRSANRYSNIFSRNVELTPAASVTPSANGSMSFQLTSDTQLTIKVKGSDAVVRSASLTLS